MASQWEQVRSFLVNAWPTWTVYARFRRFLHHVITHIFAFAHPRAIMAALRRDSKVADDVAVKRQMVHLKTKEECRLGNETIQVWTIELPSKHAEGVLKVIKEEIPGQDNIDLQHLRRFAKPKYLPDHVLGKRNPAKDICAVPRAWENTPQSVMQASSTATWEWSNPSKTRNNGRPSTLHLLVCPVQAVDYATLRDVLADTTPFASNAESWAYPLELKEITVPRLAPTSPEQANAWSDEYWPTFYRKTNPFGAHPLSIERAEQDLQYPQDDNTGIDGALALAEKAGNEARRRGLGVGTGCCIMERVDGQANIIAVAGDARFKPLPNDVADETSTGCCQGNMMGHAVMRAVGMIGRKRLRVATPTVTRNAAKAESNFAKGGLEHDTIARDAFFLDLPVTDFEKEYFARDNLKPDGYLCLKLEIFLTHEPCMMCSMALVHSRVGRVIFKHRMPKTGGLTAEMVSNDSGPVGLGYGLCWRKELNWQFMCWEYMPAKEQGTACRQDLGKVSLQKYHEEEDTKASKSANVTDDSFARMHV